MEGFRKILYALDLSRLSRVLRIGCWETGIGKALNCCPQVFGQQLVLRLIASNTKIPLYYFIKDNRIYAVVPPELVSACSDTLFNSPAVEIWMPGGWYSGAAYPLSDEEKDGILSEVSDENIYGTLGAPESSENGMLLKITRSAPCTGENGPARYAWIWAVLSLYLFLFPRRKKS